LPLVFSALIFFWIFRFGFLAFFCIL
jgi:hypothetical protein